jgi:hypothetical protein
MTELALLKAIRIVQAHDDDPEVVACLRRLAHAATELVVKRTGIDSWLIGRPGRLAAFSPRGSGLLPLALLLEQRGKRFTPTMLIGEPISVRALRARIMGVIEHLVMVEPAFGFLLVTLHFDDDCLSVSDLARHPRVSVDLG